MVLGAALGRRYRLAGPAILDLNVHRLAGKIISSLPRWLITMMIMAILTRDLALPRGTGKR